MRIEQKALLDELASQRTSETVSSTSPVSGGPPRYAIAALVFLLIAAGVGWQLTSSEPAVQQDAHNDPNPSLESQQTVEDTRQAPEPRLQTPASTTVLDATGYVVARRQAAVSAKMTGKVAEILIEEGMLVEEGQLLARLDDRIPRAEYNLAVAELEGARLAANEVRISFAQAQRELRRVDTLAASEFASAAMLERAQTHVSELRARIASALQNIEMAERKVAVRQQVLSDTEVRAPFTGIVTTKSAQPGEMISPVSAGSGFTRTGIGTIVDMSSLEVEVDVNEAFIDRVYAAQPAHIILNAYPDHEFPASVTAIIPTADRNKATIRIRVGFLERDERVLPGMGVRVSFIAEPITHPDVLN